MPITDGRGLSAVLCQGCAQAWLMPGARAGEAYICKACGHPLSVAKASNAGERAGFGPGRAVSAATANESTAASQRADGSR